MKLEENNQFFQFIDHKTSLMCVKTCWNAALQNWLKSSVKKTAGVWLTYYFTA